jgi:hypothetical protein
LLSAAVLCVVAVAVVHWPAIARSDGAGAVSRASARITLVIPSTEVRRAIAESCADEAGAGYVPIVEVDADEVGVPGEGRFFRCPSGARVFLVPTGR